MPLFDKQTRALMEARLFQPIDAVFVGALFFAAFVVCSWAVFGKPTAEQLIVVLLSAILWVLSWIVIVVFRLAVIMLRLRADVVLLPNTAAQIAEQMRTGLRKPQPAPSGA